MEYLLSFLLLGLNLLDYEFGINNIIFLAVGTVLTSALFFVCYKKTKSILAACLMLMCHTWQISWINIFGDPISVLQLPWFYIVGLVLFIYTLSRLATIKDKPVNAVMLGIFVTLCIVAVYPLLISPSITEGLKEFIMIGFFVVLVFSAFLQKNEITSEQRELVISSYIWETVICCIMIIVQYLSYTVLGEALFKFSLGIYMGHSMISCSLLMEDTSCATIMLGSAVFFMIERFNTSKKKALYAVLIVITVIGLALTSRRTSTVSLVGCFMLYVPFRYKGVMKKITMFSALSAVVVLMISYLLIVRPMDDYSQLLDANGRIGNYLLSLDILLEHPLGIGYDNVALYQLTEGIVPHNTFLRWVNMGGIIFVVLMATILVYCLNTAKKKKLHGEFWIILYSMIAMNFIPDILNSRFFVIPCMLAMLAVSQKDADQSYKRIRESRPETKKLRPKSVPKRV